MINVDHFKVVLNSVSKCSIDNLSTCLKSEITLFDLPKSLIVKSFFNKNSILCYL